MTSERQAEANRQNATKSTGLGAMRQAVIYLRVSTIDQTTANQERELREIASRMGCEIVKVYRDHGISGAKAATSDRRSTSCAVMPRDGNSTWSWRGRWTG